MIILFLVCEPDMFVFFASTCLGKLVATLAIIYFTHLNYLHGLLVCLLVILFYQSYHINLMRKLEGFASPHSTSEYNGLYDVQEDLIDTDISAKEAFQKEHCENNQLMFKNFKVRSESAPCVFPELKFRDKPCNICNNSCRASIIPMNE